MGAYGVLSYIVQAGISLGCRHCGGRDVAPGQQRPALSGVRGLRLWAHGLVSIIWDFQT